MSTLSIIGKWNAKRSSIPYRKVLELSILRRLNGKGASWLVDMEGARMGGYDDCFEIKWIFHGKQTRDLYAVR
ncbi:hypothetical protein TNCV_3114811 [Trichonephila clavipes]|nr:hypothetical protein TNCV_3114811 [Trichonephila clavipes]